MPGVSLPKGKVVKVFTSNGITHGYNIIIDGESKPIYYDKATLKVLMNPSNPQIIVENLQLTGNGDLILKSADGFQVCILRAAKEVVDTLSLDKNAARVLAIEKDSNGFVSKIMLYIGSVNRNNMQLDLLAKGDYDTTAKTGSIEFMVQDKRNNTGNVCAKCSVEGNVTSQTVKDKVSKCVKEYISAIDKLLSTNTNIVIQSQNSGLTAEDLFKHFVSKLANTLNQGCNIYYHNRVGRIPREYSCIARFNTGVILTADDGTPIYGIFESEINYIDAQVPNIRSEIQSRVFMSTSSNARDAGNQLYNNEFRTVPLTLKVDNPKVIDKLKNLSALIEEYVLLLKEYSRLIGLYATLVKNCNQLLISKFSSIVSVSSGEPNLVISTVFKDKLIGIESDSSAQAVFNIQNYKFGLRICVVAMGDITKNPKYLSRHPKFSVSLVQLGAENKISLSVSAFKDENLDCRTDAGKKAIRKVLNNFESRLASLLGKDNSKNLSDRDYILKHKMLVLESISKGSVSNMEVKNIDSDLVLSICIQHLVVPSTLGAEAFVLKSQIGLNKIDLLLLDISGKAWSKYSFVSKLQVISDAEINSAYVMLLSTTKKPIERIASRNSTVTKLDIRKRCDSVLSTLDKKLESVRCENNNSFTVGQVLSFTVATDEDDGTFDGESRVLTFSPDVSIRHSGFDEIIRCRLRFKATVDDIIVELVAVEDNNMLGDAEFSEDIEFGTDNKSNKEAVYTVVNQLADYLADNIWLDSWNEEDQLSRDELLELYGDTGNPDGEDDTYGGYSSGYRHSYGGTRTLSDEWPDNYDDDYGD